MNGTDSCIKIADVVPNEDDNIIYINQTVNNTIIIINQETAESPSPQYAQILIMALIFSGTISFMGLQAFEEYRTAKNKESKINITGLTDFELQPIEKQDMNYEEALSYFNTARNS